MPHRGTSRRGFVPGGRLDHVFFMMLDATCSLTRALREGFNYSCLYPFQYGVLVLGGPY